MSYKDILSLKIRDWKCFLPSHNHQGFDEIKPINIIIGKNNSGKSKIVDFLQDFIVKNSQESNLKLTQDIRISKKLLEREVTPIFASGHTGGWQSYLLQRHIYNTEDIYEGAGKYLVGKKISNVSGKWVIDHNLHIIGANQTDAIETASNEISKNLRNPFFEYDFIKIGAERDLRKEGVNFGGSENYDVDPNGTRLTEILVRCLQEQNKDHKRNQNLVEITLLNKINSVLAPDINFRRIYAKVDKGLYEIFLEEEHKGGIPISDCGSGIKTVIFVMVMLYIVPKFRKKDKFMFCFEELENNLHPSLERRLLVHIRDYMYENQDSFLCMTTHSSVAIDLFSKDENAQIIQVKNDGKASFVTKLDTWNHHHSLLNDLGVKASDVLQANCLIWLEGPSDRVYLRKWIDLFNDGDLLEEDVHYQCVFYGGAVLSNFSANPEDTGEEFIKMLKINRNAVIVMDSDRSSKNSHFKRRVKRILSESKDKRFVFIICASRGRYYKCCTYH